MNEPAFGVNGFPGEGSGEGVSDSGADGRGGAVRRPELSADSATICLPEDPLLACRCICGEAEGTLFARQVIAYGKSSETCVGRADEPTPPSCEVLMLAPAGACADEYVSQSAQTSRWLRR